MNIFFFSMQVPISRFFKRPNPQIMTFRYIVIILIRASWFFAIFTQRARFYVTILQIIVYALGRIGESRPPDCMKGLLLKKVKGQSLSEAQTNGSLDYRLPLINYCDSVIMNLGHCDDVIVDMVFSCSIILHYDAVTNFSQSNSVALTTPVFICRRM